MRIVLSLLFSISVAALATPFSAQAQPRHAPDRVVHLDGAGVIHGRRQQPSVITVLPSATVTHDRREQRARFLPEVARAVQHRPF